jgi:deoxyribose-phosphate aldolase
MRVTDRERVRTENSAPHAARNPGTPLALDVLASVRINRSAVERRVAALPARRTVKKAHQAAWLLRAITFMDLTALSGDDTPGNIRRLCAKALHPVREDLLERLGVADRPLHVGAVCVYASRVPDALAALRGAPIPVAAVAGGFPAGQIPLAAKIEEIRQAVAAGAQEIDAVIAREYVLGENWPALYEEISAFRAASGAALLKVILATGELGRLRNVAIASHVAMMAGADFVKTSTGKEPVNATLAVGLVMTRAVREYAERTGHQVGFKPAGGVRTAKQALDWMILMKEELGKEWLVPSLFRIGASALLTDVERQLAHAVSGAYSAAHHHPMP